MSLTPQTSSVIENLTAAEMSIAERASGLSVATLEDANYPKVDLLAALGWVYAKRQDPTLTFAAYKDSRTLMQITEELGIDVEDDDEDEGKEKPAAKRAKKSST